MPIITSDIKFYKSSVGESEGGSIDTASEITDATIENLFDNVTSDEAADGLTDYRKFFVKNTHASIEWANVFAWINSITPSEDSEISLGVGSAIDNDGSIELLALSQESTIKVQSNGTDSRNLYLVGELNGTRVTETLVLSNDNVVTGTQRFTKLYQAYVTSQNATCEVTITQVTGNRELGVIGENKLSAILYQNPISKENGFRIGSLAAAASAGLWVKRVIQAGAAAYDADQVAVRCEGETT